MQGRGSSASCPRLQQVHQCKRSTSHAAGSRHPPREIEDEQSEDEKHGNEKHRAGGREDRTSSKEAGDTNVSRAPVGSGGRVTEQEEEPKEQTRHEVREATDRRRTQRGEHDSNRVPSQYTAITPPPPPVPSPPLSPLPHQETLKTPPPTPEPLALPALGHVSRPLLPG